MIGVNTDKKLLRKKIGAGGFEPCPQWGYLPRIPSFIEIGEDKVMESGRGWD